MQQLRSAAGSESNRAPISALMAEGTPVSCPRSAIIATNSSAKRDSYQLPADLIATASVSPRSRHKARTIRARLADAE